YRGEIENIELGFGDHIDYEIDEITNSLQSDYSKERNASINKIDNEIDYKADDRNNEIDNEMDNEAEFEDDEAEFDKIDEIKE
ncbi:7951_t:CDS:1, partial [Racocetra fulgida]